MRNKNETILLKSYEPLMHRLLRKYKVKMDYEDNLQELRITALEAIREYEKSTNPKKKKTKQITYIYHSLKNRIRNILRVNYRIDLEKRRKETIKGVVPAYDLNNLTEKEKLEYNLANPEGYEDFSNDYEIVVIPNSESPAKMIRFKCNVDIFKKDLSPINKNIWDLKESGMNQKKISKKLEIPQTKISRRLVKMRDDFKDFLISGVK